MLRVIIRVALKAVEPSRSAIHTQVSTRHAKNLPTVLSTTTPRTPQAAFTHSFRRSRLFPHLGENFTLHPPLAGSLIRKAKRSLLSYGPVVHFPLLSTPPHGDAVMFRFGTGFVIPTETYTLLIPCACARTSAAGLGRLPSASRPGWLPLGSVHFQMSECG